MSEKYNEYLKLLKIYVETKDYKGVLKMAEKMIDEEPLSYDAHFFKAMAMSRLISYENQIVSDVIKSVYTAYKLLNEEGQNLKREELSFIIGFSFSMMIGIILEEYKKKRPTEKLTVWVTDSINNMAEEFKKALSYIDITDNSVHMKKIQNTIIEKTTSFSVAIWKEAVWADYSKDCNINGKWINDDYRPDEETMLRFAKETMCLVSLLSFAEKGINETTSAKAIYNLYNLKCIIAYQIPKATAYEFHKEICVNGIMMYNYFKPLGMLSEETREKYLAIGKKYDALADEYEQKL